MFNGLLKKRIERLEHELETAQRDLNIERSARERAEKLRADSERSFHHLNNALLSKSEELDRVRRRNPPSNVLKTIHTIQGREIIEAQDGSLWQRVGDAWQNINLPDTSAPTEAM